MSFVLRSVLLRLVGLGVLALVLFGASKLPTEEGEKYFRVTDADVTVQVQPDASLRVTEKLRFDFTGSFSGAYRDIPLAEGVTASSVRVSEAGRRYEPGGDTRLGSFDRPGTFGAVQLRIPDADGGPTAGFRVVWHYSASDEARDFEVSYSIDGAATAYDDVVEIPWAVWGDQWSFFLDDLRASIELADGNAVPEAAWLAPRILGDDPELAPGAATVSTRRIASGRQAELRAVFPRSAFASVEGAQQRSGDGLATILEEEREISDDQGLLSSFAALVGSNLRLIAGLWTALLLLIAAALYLMGRDRRADSVPEHLPEPPEDVPPALAFALAREGTYDDRVVLATLLDLVDRGFYDSRPTEGKDLDLELSIPAERPGDGALLDYEQEAIEFFDRLLKKGPCKLGKLKGRIPKHSESWRKRWTALNDALDRAEEGHLHWDRDLVWARRVLLAVAIVGYLAIAAAYTVRTAQPLEPIFWLLAGPVLIYSLPATWLMRLEPDSRRRNAEWAAFQRWTDDFPRLDDDPPATLKLWRRILVYAVAFGTAERVVSSGRIPAGVLEEAEAMSFWTATHMTTHGALTASFDGFSSGFASQVAPQSSSGSGGFSGGGGGFSGGGGGGAW